MRWRRHSEIPEGSHAFLSGSQYSWLNYDQNKLVESYNNRLASERGTRLHEFAKQCILLKRYQPSIKETLCMYVNDAIDLNMQPEQILYYSRNAYGIADAISFDNNFLRIHDLKTGRTPASLHQLEVYAAYFCLEYDRAPIDLNGIELRIYQNDNVIIGRPGVDVILPIMDKIIYFDQIISRIKEDQYYGL